MKKSLIAEAFNKCKKEKRAALLTYTVAGDNTKRKSLEILKKISSSVDIVELAYPITLRSQMVAKFKIQLLDHLRME